MKLGISKDYWRGNRPMTILSPSRKSPSGNSLMGLSSLGIRNRLKIPMPTIPRPTITRNIPPTITQILISALSKDLSDHFFLSFTKHSFFILQWSDWYKSRSFSFQKDISLGKNMIYSKNYNISKFIHSIWYFFHLSIIDCTLIVSFPLSKKFHTTSQFYGFGVLQLFAITSKNFDFEMGLLKSSNCSEFQNS